MMMCHVDTYIKNTTFAIFSAFHIHFKNFVCITVLCCVVSCHAHVSVSHSV